MYVSKCLAYLPCLSKWPGSMTRFRLRQVRGDWQLSKLCHVGGFPPFMSIKQGARFVALFSCLLDSLSIKD